MSSCSWAKKPMRNILLDINGVLFESGEDHALRGSVEAMKSLVENGFNFCLVTNECTTAKRLLAKKLNKFGFDCVSVEKIVSPAPVACRYLLDNNLRPRLHVWDGILEDFQPIFKRHGDDQSKWHPNCIVIGDVMTKLSQNFMDESLELMLNSSERPKLIALGSGRYYKDAGRLRMDTGAYVAAFEYCLNGSETVNLGKPQASFFEEALKVVGGTVEDTIMIGDDIVGDVGGAQKLGMRGFLVRTGKYKSSDETHSAIKADFVFDNFREAMQTLVRENVKT